VHSIAKKDLVFWDGAGQIGYSHIPVIPFERSRWRGRRYACYTPRVMPQRGFLFHCFRFRSILATPFNSIDYSQKSIEIP
jgi:hypothetical protein